MKRAEAERKSAQLTDLNSLNSFVRLVECFTEAAEMWGREGNICAFFADCTASHASGQWGVGVTHTSLLPYLILLTTTPKCVSSTNQCHNVGSAQLYTMSLQVAVLHISSTGTKMSKNVPA